MYVELKNLVKTSDNDGIRRQAVGALEALGVMMERASATGTRLNIVTTSSHQTSVSIARGWLSTLSAHSSFSCAAVLTDVASFCNVECICC